MTVVCKECGKVYHLDPDKVDQYKGQNIRVRCGECGHVTQLSKLIEEEKDDASQLFGEEAYTEATPGEESVEAQQFQAEPTYEEAPERAPREAQASRRRGIFGLRSKMAFLFLLIPVALIAASGYFSQYQLNELADHITERSTELVLQEGKEKIMQKARDVALQCEVYLRAHPELKREDFNYDPEFSSIALQGVGETGYTTLIQEPEPEKGIKSTIWAHPNPNMVGLGDPEMLRKALGPFFEPFWDVVSGSFGSQESEGFYQWKDADGKIREKYMAIAPIDTGDKDKPFLMMATAYTDEFTQKTESLKDFAGEMARDTRNINFGILIGAIVIIGLCVSIYGHRLTRDIRYLTEAAERISLGDLEAEIEVKSKDEIGHLADAISRMQDSLRFSIERLRRRW